MEPCQIINLSRSYMPKVRIPLKSETIAGAHLPGAYCICGLHKFAEKIEWSLTGLLMEKTEEYWLWRGEKVEIAHTRLSASIKNSRKGIRDWIFTLLVCDPSSCWTSFDLEVSSRAVNLPAVIKCIRVKRRGSGKSYWCCAIHTSIHQTSQALATGEMHLRVTFLLHQCKADRIQRKDFRRWGTVWNKACIR